MIYDKVLKGKNISLRMVELSDCSHNYLKWLNDSDVNQYLETRWTEQTIESIKSFVQSVRDSSHSYLFAIIYNNNHIGNIKLGPIQPVHKYADISYFIGDKACWGKNIATEAINVICDFAFNTLKLNKLCAGVYENNIGSQKALLKNNFVQEGIKRKQYIFGSHETVGGGGFQLFGNVREYGLLASEYEKE